jgi:tetratricopeptide (TPR) repeat protein
MRLQRRAGPALPTTGWRRHATAAAVVVAVALLSGCMGKADPQQFLDSAKQLSEKRQWAAADAQLKAALQARPDWPEARFVLGRNLLERGSPGPATVELRRALELKHDPDAVTPLLAKAAYQLGEHQKSIDEFRPVRLGNPKAQA